MRGKRAKTRQQLLDPKYGSAVIGRLINKVMQGGRKTIAEKMVYGALEKGAEEVKEKEDNKVKECTGRLDVCNIVIISHLFLFL